MTQRHHLAAESLDVETIGTLYAHFNARRFDEAAALFADDAILEQVPAPRREIGPAGYRVFVASWVTAFPDAVMTVDSVEPRGSGRYEIDLSATGTHIRPLDVGGGIVFKPSGARATLRLRQLLELKDGRITYSSLSLDFQDFVAQLVTVDVRKLLNHLERLRALTDNLQGLTADATVDRNTLILRIGTELDSARQVVRPYFDR
jgi:hypothetical protein